MAHLPTIARRAISWLAKAIGFYKQIDPDFGQLRALLGENKKTQRMLKRIMSIEEKWGATSDFFGKIETAVKNRTDVRISYDEARYIYKFKQAFDSRFKAKFRDTKRISNH